MEANENSLSVQFNSISDGYELINSKIRIHFQQKGETSFYRVIFYLNNSGWIELGKMEYPFAIGFVSGSTPSFQYYNISSITSASQTDSAITVNCSSGLITDSYGNLWTIYDLYTLTNTSTFVDVKRYWCYRGSLSESDMLLPFNLTISFPGASIPRRVDYLMMPGLCYNGNVVTDYDLQKGWYDLLDYPKINLENESQKFLFQEERFPSPFVSWEYSDYVVGLETEPSQNFRATLGFTGNQDYFHLMSCIGSWTSGGIFHDDFSTYRLYDQIPRYEPSHYYVEHTWNTIEKKGVDVALGQIFTKNYRIYLARNSEQKNFGFYQVLRNSWDWINSSYSNPSLWREIYEIMDYKSNLGLSKYYYCNETGYWNETAEIGIYAGFCLNGSLLDLSQSSNKEWDKWMIGGESGQVMGVAYSLLQYGFLCNNQTYIDVAEKVIDWYVNETIWKGTISPDFCQAQYFDQPCFWSGRRLDSMKRYPQYTQKAGEVISHVLRAYVLEKNFGTNISRWYNYSKNLLEVYVENQFPSGCYPSMLYYDLNYETIVVESNETASGVLIALAMLEMYDITGNNTYLDSALSAMNYYETNYLNQVQVCGFDTGAAEGSARSEMRHIMDYKTCEYFTRVYMKLYELTNDPSYLSKTEKSAKVLSTWIYNWNVNFDHSSILYQNNFKTKGCVQISIEKHALTPAYSSAYTLKKASMLLNNRFFDRLSDLVLKGSSQMLSTEGKTLGMNTTMIGAQSTYWYHTNWTAEEGMAKGNMSDRCWASNIAELFTCPKIEKKITLDTLPLAIRNSTVTLRVNITDTSSNPIDNVRVKLTDVTTGTNIGFQITDSDGIAEIDYELREDELLGNHCINIMVIDPFIEAKPGLHNITVYSRPIITLAEVISTTRGDTVTIVLYVTDEMGNPLSISNITIFDYNNNTIVMNLMSNSTGYATFDWNTPNGHPIGKSKLYFTIGNEGYNLDAINNAEITVYSQPNVDIKIKNSCTRGDNVTIYVTVTDENDNPIPNIKVKFVDSTSGIIQGYAYTNASGVAVFSYVFPDNSTLGKHKIKVIVKDAGYYLSASDSENIEVYSKPTIKIRCNDDIINEEDMITFKVSVKDENGTRWNGLVYVYVNGTLIKSLNITDGAIKFSITFDKEGTYVILFELEEKDYYKKVSKTKLITVLKKASLVPISEIPNTISLDEPLVFWLNLSYIDGEPISYELIYLLINNKTTELFYTNSSGICEIIYHFETAGTFTLTCLYSGNASADVLIYTFEIKVTEEKLMFFNYNSPVVYALCFLIFILDTMIAIKRWKNQNPIQLEIKPLNFAKY